MATSSNLFTPLAVNEGDTFIRRDSITFTAHWNVDSSGRKTLRLVSPDGFMIHAGAYRHVFDGLGLKKL